MCEFCENIAKTSSEYALKRFQGGDFITKDGDGYGLLIDTGDSGCLGYIKINYCPMCGRKLVEEKKNPFNVCRDNPNCEVGPEKCGYSVDCTTWGDLAEGKRTYMCGMQNKCPHSKAE